MSIENGETHGPIGLGAACVARLWLQMRSHTKGTLLPLFDTISTGPTRSLSKSRPSDGAVSVLRIFGRREKNVDEQPVPWSAVAVTSAASMQRLLSSSTDVYFVVPAYRSHGLRCTDLLLKLEVAGAFAERSVRPNPDRNECGGVSAQNAPSALSWQSAPPAPPWLNYQNESIPDHVVCTGHSVVQSVSGKRNRTPINVRYDLDQRPVDDHRKKGPSLRPLAHWTALRRTGSETLFDNLVQQANVGLPALSSVSFAPSAELQVGRPGLGSVSSAGSDGSDAPNVTTGADERSIRVDANKLGDLVVGDYDTTESGWPSWSIPGIASCLWRVVSVSDIPAKGRPKSLLGGVARRAAGYSVALAVVPTEVHTDESTAPVVQPGKKQNRGDIFTELAARLDFNEDFLCRTLISRPGVVDLISQTQSRGRDPKLEELGGSDPNNFVEALHSQLTSVNQVATTDPLPVLAPTPPWAGGVVTIRDLIPKMSDRERIAKMQRALLANGVRAWTTGARRLRTSPLIVPPSVIYPLYLEGGGLVLSRPRELRAARRLRASETQGFSCRFQRAGGQMGLHRPRVAIASVLRTALVCRLAALWDRGQRQL